MAKFRARATPAQLPGNLEPIVGLLGAVYRVARRRGLITYGLIAGFPAGLRMIGVMLTRMEVGWISSRSRAGSRKR
jgi:hypothetical protein